MSNMMLEHVRSMHFTCLLVLHLCLKIGSQGEFVLSSFDHCQVTSVLIHAENLVAIFASLWPSHWLPPYQHITTYTCYHSRLVPRGTPRVSFTGSNRIHKIYWKIVKIAFLGKFGISVKF